MIYKEKINDSRLRMFWSQCLSLLLLGISGLVILNILNFSFYRLILDVLLISSISIIYFISRKTNKLDPYRYILFFISNLFLILVAMKLEGVARITLFIYFPLNILYTAFLFDRRESIPFIFVQIFIYVHIILSLINYKTVDTSIYVCCLVQIIIMTSSLMYFLVSVIKMYDVNEKYLIKSKNKYKEDAYIDTLTEVGNRRYMEKKIEQFIRDEKKFSIIMYDIDHFKGFNDTYGHQTGDEVLYKFALILKEQIKDLGYVTRYGGEEFIVILPELNKMKAKKKADEIRKKVEENLTVTGVEGKITVSGGVFEYEESMSLDELIKKTDQKLYEAKESGRNNIK